MAINSKKILLLFLLSNLIGSWGAPTNPVQYCHEKEREALLKFKELNKVSIDDVPQLSSWDRSNKYCCAWRGIRCDKEGHVVKLDIGSWGLSHAKINESLIDLKHLHYLTLGGNSFSGTSIPRFIGSLKKLRYLDLAHAHFGGVIPHELGNLSMLQGIDLRGNDNLQIDDAFWISKLTSLTSLNVDEVTFGVSSNWLQSINMLPSLQEVTMKYCDLGVIPFSIPNNNLTSLSLLDLSYTSPQYSNLPSWLFNFSSLQYLYLSSIRYQGSIPAAIGNLTSLKLLDLSYICQLEPGLPESLGNLCQLQHLDLSNSTLNTELDRLRGSFSGCINHSLEYLDMFNTSLTGNLPSWLGELRNLKHLDISYNLINGPIYDFLNSLSKQNSARSSQLITLNLAGNSLVGNLTENYFLNLGNLKRLTLNANFLFLNISPDWTPPFQLEKLSMIGCRVGPRIPAWIRTQKELTILEMSSMEITDPLPDWFWNITSNIWMLDLCCNGIPGYLPDSFNFSRKHGLVIRLIANQFEGPLPLFPSNTHFLELSGNQFHGPIPANICQKMPSLVKLRLSVNNINGSLPPSLCDCQDLMIFEIENTNISGQLPACHTPPKSLRVLWIVNNTRLSGGIPLWVCSVPVLQSLHLINNNFSGEFPSSLNRCHELLFLDLSGNKFSGSIPNWLSEGMPKLKSLSLSANMFTGVIPSHLSQLAYLRFLDISSNGLSGVIPRSIGQFASMKNDHTTVDDNLYIFVSEETGFTFEFFERKTLSFKGREYLYESKMLKLVILINLSYNKLSGSIPDEVMDLVALQSLNLTGNQLTGRVPEKIGNMQQLQALELSQNNLCGAIPSMLSKLSFLAILNLSFNNFSGPIPSGGQLDTFDQLTYMGNSYLCGFPLAVKCQSSVTETEQIFEADLDNEMGLFYLCTGIGFACGICLVIGCMFNKTWMVTFCYHVDIIFDSVFVTTKLSLKKFKERGFCIVWEKNPKQNYVLF